MIYFNIQVVRGRQRVIRLLQEQIVNVREHCPCPSRLLHSLVQPQDCQFGLWPHQQCHSATPLLLTALSLMLQEGEDKIFLIEKLHCVYKQRQTQFLSPR